MKIVADENILLLEHFFKSYGELILKPGRDITQKDLRNADILLVRSVTKVNQALLENTSVKFVGSVTSGADHMDTSWLENQKIKWYVAEGCNAVAVAEYVICVIAALQSKGYLTKPVKAAVVGVGKIGTLVVDKFKLLGFDVVLCDPLRNDVASIPFNELSDFDLISFHTPLIKTGSSPTYHMVQKEFLKKQKNNCILFNTSRGEVFAFDQLKKYGTDLKWCLDVWENEPFIHPTVLKQTLIATPHIAGYSIQSKFRGVEMVYKAMVTQGVIQPSTLSNILLPIKKIKISNASSWQEVVLNIFNPNLVTQDMQQTMALNPGGFDLLRKKFAERYEFAFIDFEFLEDEEINLTQFDKTFLKKLGFSC